MVHSLLRFRQAAEGLLPEAGRPRRKPARNCLERSAALQVIAVLIAACALMRLMLACYADNGLTLLLAERRVLRTLTDWTQHCLVKLSTALSSAACSKHC